MEDVDYDTWKPLVERATAYVCRDFPDVEREDISQHLWMKLMENRQHITSHEERGVPTMLSRWGTTYAWDLRKEHLQLSPQYSYRTSDIKKVLDVIFDKRDWENAVVPDDARSEFSCSIEVATDIYIAYEKLGHAQKQAIFERYALGVAPKDDAGVKRLYRAVCALTDKLNWYQKQPDRDYVGTRKVLTNANARANISHQEN